MRLNRLSVVVAALGLSLGLTACEKKPEAPAAGTPATAEGGEKKADDKGGEAAKPVEKIEEKKAEEPKPVEAVKPPEAAVPTPAPTPAVAPAPAPAPVVAPAPAPAPAPGEAPKAP